MEELLWPIMMLLAAALLLYLGIRSRKNAYQGYQDDLQRYTATTTMTITNVEKRITERWEDRDDGSREIVYDTDYLPTYEYTVDGKPYRYQSRQSTFGPKAVGKQVPGYYDPKNPESITENKPQKPVLGGVLFFLMAAILAVFGLVQLYNFFSVYFW